MTQDQAYFPQLLAVRGNKIIDNIICVFLGVIGLSLLAQLTLSLPWTPVPVTGQTFGVSLTALLWGRKRGLAVMMTYLSIGALGFPVFAFGKAGLSLGPTLGYIVGMVIASYWIGFLSDQGWTKTFSKTYLAAASGSIIIFFCGALGLSSFIPSKELFNLGVLPFLPGDLIKTLLASYLAFKTNRKSST